jgi:hypothetical protein
MMRGTQTRGSFIPDFAAAILMFSKGIRIPSTSSSRNSVLDWGSGSEARFRPEIVPPNQIAPTVFFDEIAKNKGSFQSFFH